MFMGKNPNNVGNRNAGITKILYLILLYRYIARIVSKNFGHLHQFKVSGRNVLGSARKLTLIK